MRSLIDLLEAAPAAVASDPSKLVIPSGYGIRWHKVVNIGVSVTWVGSFQIKTGEAFKLAASTSYNDARNWTYKFDPAEWGFVPGAIAAAASDIAVKGLFVMCDAVKPSSVKMVLGNNLPTYVIPRIKAAGNDFDRLGYGLNPKIPALIRRT